MTDKIHQQIAGRKRFYKSVDVENIIEDGKPSDKVYFIYNFNIYKS